MLSIACAVTGKPEEAETHLASALEVARAHGLTQLLGALLQNRAKNLDRTERYADALAAAQEAYQAYGEAGDGARQANVGTMVAAFLTECGRYAEAETILLDSIGLFERQEPSRFLVLARLTLASLYLDWQPPHGKVLALKLARSALEQVTLDQMPGITALAFAALARAEACSGNAGAALSHAREAVRLAGPAADESAFLSLAALAAAHEAQGETGVAVAVLVWQEAVEAATTRGFILDARRSALETARLTDDAEAARAHCAWFEARGLVNGVNLARRYFPQVAQLPANVWPPYPPRPSGHSALFFRRYRRFPRRSRFPGYRRSPPGARTQAPGVAGAAGRGASGRTRRGVQARPAGRAVPGHLLDPGERRAA